MTYKEAFEVCRDLPPTNYSEACKKALEKQTPKKPIYESKMPRCPSCRSWIQNNESIQKYCNFCGQALDWSDT